MVRFFAVLALVCSLLGGSLHGKEIAQLAHEIACKDVSASEWKKFVTSTRAKYETWANDNADGNLKRYLDDKLVQLAPAVANGDIKALKKFVYWIALYAEFNEPAHSRLDDLMAAHGNDLETLLQDFSWERASEMIKIRRQEYRSGQRKLAQR